MFSRIKGFLHRHRRKFVVGGILIGGAVLLSRYTQRKIREWQENETKELLERSRRQLHFDQIERTCNQTALTLAPNLKEAVGKCFNIDELLEQLKSGVSNKLSIWEELKILSFSKVAALVYANSMLMVTLRIQLNLIGGYMFKTTIEESTDVQVDRTIQGKYLSRCEFLIEKGIPTLSSLIESKVRLILKDKSLKEKLTLSDLEQIFWSIQTSLNNDKEDPCKNLTQYVLPSIVDSLSPGDQLNTYNKMILETTDLLDSEEIVSLTASSVSRGFTHVVDQLSGYYALTKDSIEQDGDKASASKVNISSTTIPLAKVIPIVNGLVQNEGNTSEHRHSWMEQLILMDNLKVLGANVYEAFSH